MVHGTYRKGTEKNNIDYSVQKQLFSIFAPNCKTMKTKQQSISIFRLWLPVTIMLAGSFVMQAQLIHLPNENDIPPHPRILMLAGEEQQIKTNMDADPAWRSIHQSIIEACDILIEVPVSERMLEGRRLLGVSREALRRIFYLSYAYRMTGQDKYADRAEKEMLAVSSFSDWNPSHFLDAAEMTMAVSIGYDWLFHKLSPSSRETIKKAILQKGLDPSLNSEYNGWLRLFHNWNQVCNSGMAYGALAIFEDLPDFSKMIIDRAIESMKLPMSEYAPDGVYPEGYGYWDYGTSFNVMFLEAINKIWKTDFNLSQTPGFMKTGNYIMHMTGVTGYSFNYSDNGLYGNMYPTMFWFANKTKDKSILWDQRKRIDSGRSFTHDRLLPALLIWGGDIRLAEIKHSTALMWVGKSVAPVALMRTSWTDPNAIFVGFKGGMARSNHAHMDAGSFVMEANGVRWASDFGPQDYNSLETRGIDLWNMNQNSQRWQVFRYNNFSHNTLTVNNQLHIVDGSAEITSWSSNTAFMNIVSDMSKVFEGHLSRSVRGVAIVNGQYVVVRDEVTTTDKEATIRWTMMTSANVAIKGKNTIELRKDGKRLTLQVSEPSNVTMKTWTTTSTNEYDAPNPGTILVGFEAKVPAGATTALTVKLIPQNTKNTGTKVPELNAWPKN